MTAPTKLAQRVTEVAAQMETERAALAEPDRPSGVPARVRVFPDAETAAP